MQTTIGMNNRYTLVRHGQTHWNKNGTTHGRYDIPLNYVGECQARKVAKDLSKENFDLYYCSPLRRAKSTIDRIVFARGDVKVEYDSRLVELDKGLLEGKYLNSRKMFKNESPQFLEKFGVESKQAFFSRVKSFIDDVESNYRGRDVLIVAHSGTIKMIMFAFDPPGKAIYQAYRDIHIENCKPYKLGTTQSEDVMRIGLFPMVADVLHAGHVVALEEAKNHCDFLIVGLNCNPAYKDPNQSIYERYMQLRAVKWVDEVIPYENSERDADMFLSLKYDVYFAGEDHRNDEWEMKKTIESLNKKIVYLNRKHNYSSTRVKNGI